MAPRARAERAFPSPMKAMAGRRRPVRLPPHGDTGADGAAPGCVSVVSRRNRMLILVGLILVGRGEYASGITGARVTR